jgi:hypothetical protein
MNQAIGTFDTKVTEIFNYIERPSVVKGVVTLFLMLYAARVAPVPPKAILNLFENVYFKLFIFSLILWTAQVSPSMSIMIALAFMVTINYTTTGKVWEMMENTSGSSSVNMTVSPTAPTQAIAMQAAATVMADQTANTQTVSNIAQNPTTIVITPSIVQTPQGPTVVNPSVVISSAIVKDATGQQVVVTPSVTSVVPSAPSVAPMAPSVAPMAPSVASMAITSGTSVSPDANVVTSTQSVEAVKVLALAASSPEATDKKSIANLATIALANVTTQSAATAVQQLADQASLPVAGTSDKVEAAAKTAAAGCYPMRNYDMTKVSPSIDGKVTFEDYQSFVSTLQ